MSTDTILPLGISGVILLALWRLYHRVIIKLQLRTLPGPEAASFWTGNLAQLYSKDGMQFHEQLAAMGGIVKVYGFMQDEQLYVSDPLALHYILNKQGHTFEETAANLALCQVVWGKGLNATTGDVHKRQRKILNPVFSIAHLRGLVPVFHEITEQLRCALASCILTGEAEIDVMHWMSRAALEYIGVGGLGYSFEALREGASNGNAYGTAAKQLLPALFPFFPLAVLLPALNSVLSAKTRRRLVEMLPSSFARVRELRVNIDVMGSMAEKIYTEKKRALAHGEDKEMYLEALAGKGKDIMTVLMRANMAASESDRLPEDQVIGQMNLLIFAAQDTTSTALARILQLLALHPDIQDRLRKEVEQAHADIGDGEPSYEQLMALPLMDAVIRETLRLHAPVTAMWRTALADTLLPLSKPVIGTDGMPIAQVHVRKNQNVTLGLAAVNRSPAIWGADAAEWKPERWLEPLPESVKAARVPGVYGNLMTFLGGSRACVGFKFSELEMKVALYMMLYHFNFSPSDADIGWKLSTVQVPYVKGREDGPPELPLRLSLARR